MDKKPDLSVVMGCYNNALTIKEAVDSILQQTFSNFEFFIIDDCSTDDTIAIIEKYNDPRIHIIKNKTNQGLGYSLSLGVALSRGEYIARMDADDVSFPSRFEKQIAYLREHRDVICVGTGAKKIGTISLFAKFFSRTIRPACDYEEIKAWLLIGTPILHPSVMFSAKLLKKTGLNYNPDFKKAQDFELWSRMIWKGIIRNMDDILLGYRYSAQQVSNTSRDIQIENSKVMYRRMFSYLLGREISAEELNCHILFSTKSKLSQEEFATVESWLNFLIPYIEKTTCFDKDKIVKVFSRRWRVVCRDSKNIIKRFHCYLKNKYYGNASIVNLIYLLKL